MRQNLILVLAVTFLVSCGSTKKAVEETSKVSKVETVTPPNTPSNTPQVVEAKLTEVEIKEIPFNIIETPPVFPECENTDPKLVRACFEEGVYNFVKQNFNTSVINSSTPHKDHLRLHASFKLDKYGKVFAPTFYSTQNRPILKAEALRVINSIPQMVPGKQAGESQIISYPFKIYSIIKNDTVAEIVTSKEYFNYLRKKERKSKLKKQTNTNVSSNVVSIKPKDDTPPPPNSERLLHHFMHKKWDDLLQKHMSNNGNVNYKAFKNDAKLLGAYITDLGKHIPTDTWTKNEKLAYWINAYNALTIDLILRNYPLQSIKDIDKPWEQRLWKFGDKWLNLNAIEHQILRKMDEPRIHFAIVCASESCPKLQNFAFTSEKMEEQLTQATKEFLSDRSKNEITENSIKLSKIFKWFAKDFKTDGSLIDFLNQYTEVTISSKAKKTFKEYDWALNE